MAARPGRHERHDRARDRQRSVLKVEETTGSRRRPSVAAAPRMRMLSHFMLL